MQAVVSQYSGRLKVLKVLIVDDETTMRKVTQSLLQAIGVTDIHEASDGHNARLGVNEFLIKPVSSTALLTRLVPIFAKPRAMVKKGDYYGPEPRKMSSYKPESDPALGQIVLVN
jgi:YesN/AraC family two-component response regulator